MKPVLLVVSEIGYTWEEVIAPFLEFTKENISVTVATPFGKLPKVDPYSIKIRPLLNFIGLGIHPNLAPNTDIGKKLNEYLQKAIPLKSIKADDYSAIYIAGGHGSLFDLNKNQLLHQLILLFYKSKKPVGILCHASSTIAFIKDGEELFITDKKVTGFPTIWEYLILFTHQIYKDFLPLPIWTQKELDKNRSKRNFITRILEVLNMYYVIKDKNLISGVGPKTGNIIAKKMIQMLKNS